MFSYLSSFVYSEKKEKPTVDHILAALWFCKKTDRVMTLIEKLTELDNNVPRLFLEKLTEEKVNVFTQKIIKKLLTKYNAPKWGVCKKVADFLKKDSYCNVATDDKSTSCIASACAIAIGTEKAKWNKEFYHKIRVLKSMEMAEWRKFLKEVRKRENYIAPEKTEVRYYTLGLFNEPLHRVVINTSGQDVPVISVYKGAVHKNKHCRSPIEIPLDTPLTQKDLNIFLKEKRDEPMVIIAKNIGKGVSPPEDVYICFMNDSESFGKGIYPYISNNDVSSTISFFDMA